MPASLARVPLDPGKLWIRFTPKRWPTPEGPWVNFASGCLGPADLKRSTDPIIFGSGPDDVVYLPATLPDFRGARDRCAEELAELGVPTVVQILPGEDRPGFGQAILDLAPLLLANEQPTSTPDAFPEVVVWPLVAGITDRSECLAHWAPRLAAAGVQVVTVMKLELSAREKRDFAEGRPDSVFEALFHGAKASEQPLAVALAAHGLRPFSSRPETSGSPAFELRRRLAGLLAEAAELDLRCERYGRGQDLYRAARYLDDSSVDLVALFRENNLRVLTWLDDAARGLLERALSGHEDALLERRATYLNRVETEENSTGRSRNDHR